MWKNLKRSSMYFMSFRPVEHESVSELVVESTSKLSLVQCQSTGPPLTRVMAPVMDLIKVSTAKAESVYWVMT